MATLNGYKISGTIASTTTFQIIYTPSNTRGFIYVVAGGPCYSMVMAFFEAYSGFSYGSLTQLATAGNGVQGVLNPPNTSTGGTVNITNGQAVACR